MTMRVHSLKSWRHLFQPMKRGEKHHDLRKMDRDYQVGDHVWLNEYDMDAGKFTGEMILRKITYITSNVTPCAVSSAVLDKGYCILSYGVVE